jgi:YcaO-like protein with predicted kinase domain
VSDVFLDQGDPRGRLAIPKGHRGGTHRLVPPEVTLARLLPLLPSLGITRVANVTGLDRIGLPVVMVCRPNARSLATTQGKGLTLAAAKVSGLMESIELDHAERIVRPMLFGSHAELAPGRALVDVGALAATRNSRYSPQLQMLWIEGYDLIGKRALWLPFETVHASAKIPPPPGSGCFAATSNGLASGNHPLEAILHGLYEVIERDATTLWETCTHAAKASTFVERATINDPDCIRVLALLDAAGVRAGVWDTRSDLGIPAFLCEIGDPALEARGQVSAFVGMGCHACPAIALLRAVTEAAQCRLTLIAGSRDDLFREEYERGDRRDRLAVLTPAHQPGTRACGFAEIAGLDADTMDAELAAVLARLAGAGLDSAIWVNLTRPEYRIAVARVVVPGLEGPDDDPEYLPGKRALAARGRAA